MIQGVHIVKKPRNDKPPIWYVYAYRGGPCVHRHEGWDRPRLTTADLEALINASAAKTIREKRQETLSDVIGEWRDRSPEWRALSKNTQKTWGSALARIEERWGHTPLTVWNDPRMASKVVVWRDSRASTPRAADTGVAVLRALLKFSRLRGLVGLNVAEGIPQLYSNGNRAEIIWTDEDISRFHATSKKLGSEHVYDGLRLAALTGLRRDDLVTLTWDEIDEHAITKRAAKKSRGRRRIATIPRIPQLDDLLEELRSRARKDGVRTVLVNSFGLSWTGDGFGGSFNRVRDDAEIVHVDADTGAPRKKHIHDLRGTFCTKLIQAGLQDHEIAEVMAWSPQQVAGIRRSYVDQSAVIVAIGERIRSSL